MKYKIEKDIKAPIGTLDFPLLDMEIGDSFIVPRNKITSLRSYMNGTFARSHGGRKFKTLGIDDKNFRCWRIK